MDNEEYQNVMKEKNFEQEFLTELKKSSDAPVEPASEKKTGRRILLIGAIVVIVLAVVAVVVGVVYTNSRIEPSVSDEESEDDFFDADTSMMEVLVAPSSAKVTIDGMEYVNGEYEIAPGEYKVLVEKDGFEPYESIVIAADKHKSYVAVCLQPVQGNEDYYEVNIEDMQICQSADEIAASTAWDQNALFDNIFNFTPFHNDGDGFYVDPYFNDKDELVVELTFKDCLQTETVLRERAYAWMREQGLDPDNYTFEETWNCED